MRNNVREYIHTSEVAIYKLNLNEVFGLCSSLNKLSWTFPPTQTESQFPFSFFLVKLAV